MIFLFPLNWTLITWRSNTIFLTLFWREALTSLTQDDIKFQWQFRPDWKNYNDQTHSCPRDWHLSASWGPNWWPPWNSSEYYSTIVLRGLRRAVIWSPIIPRDSNTSDNRWLFFSSLELRDTGTFVHGLPCLIVLYCSSVQLDSILYV